MSKQIVFLPPDINATKLMCFVFITIQTIISHNLVNSKYMHIKHQNNLYKKYIRSV